LGCGPSFQAIYEGDARFEHCYALEETANASMQQKAECWRDWTQKHTYGQTRDRVEYAASRYRALVNPELPTDEAMMQAAPGMVDTSNQLVAPAPTSAFAPPPVTTVGGVPSTTPVLTVPTVSAPPAASSAPSGPRPKAGRCVDDCSAGFDACASQSDGGVGKCDANYSKCLGACAKAK
jgi:hypothetical protein